MSWNPQTACILSWNNHTIIEAYTSPTNPIFPLPISYYLGMEYHTQYWTNIHHLKNIQGNHYYQYLLHIHHHLTILQGENNIHHLEQAYAYLCDHQP